MAAMDDLAIGRLFRELRIRLGWPQRVVAARAGISASAYSAIERGLLDTVPVGKLRKVAGVLEVRLALEPRWRGAAIDRVRGFRHSTMADEVTRILVAAGWIVRPEVSFSWYGERGIVDLVAWHAATGTVLLVEIKTELADVNDLLGTSDVRRRLAARIVEPFGWKPVGVAQLIVLAESRTNRRRLAEHRNVIRAAFPDNGHALRGWLRTPGRPLAAVWFLPDFSGTSERRKSAPILRVSRARRRPGEAADAA